MEADDPNTEKVSNNPNMQKVNRMKETNVNSSNENKNGAASFHNNSELFELPLLDPTLDLLSPAAWIPPVTKTLEQPQETTEGLELQAPADKGEGENQLNIVYDPSQHRFAGLETLEPCNQEHLQLGSSTGRDESFLDHANSNQNFKELAFPRFEGSKSSFGDGADTQQTEFSFFTPTMPNFLTQQENIPKNGNDQLQMLNSWNEVNLAKQNQFCGQYGIGNTFHVEQPSSQQMKTHNLGNNTVFSNQLGAENVTNISLNNNEQTTGMGFLNGRSAYINQQPFNTWFSNNQNDLSRPLAQPGSEMYQFKAANSFEPHSNSMLLGSSIALRPPKQYQANQEHNVVNLMQSQFDPTHFNPMMKDPLLLSRMQQLSNDQQMMQNLPNLQHHSSKLLGTPIFPGASDDQQLNQASGAPNMMNFSFQNSFLHNRSMPSRLQTIQNQGLQNQTGRPIASYPGPGTSLSNLIMDSLALQETPNFYPGRSFPLQMRESTSNKQGSDGLRGLPRSRVELGESSSPFKRFRGETSGTPQFQQNEATHSNPLNFFHPRPMRNSVYDPMYEGLGLPIDPHLRLFENSNHRLLGASVKKRTTLDL
ncbi:hypothetical protein SLEP1_g20795 [Rubroshorea leprosula]|uniref:Uncharacterized protein n=1 Tax=Rubroshorea leprosula TaxID=152421 RepID=A0AAV5JEJ6_9ROSI|nr:hypothetical protein SLEP1_g20795 [Rubroshorea leprosula]